MHTITLSLLATVVAALASPVYRCELPCEPPLFSDLPCTHGSMVDVQPAPLIQSVSTPIADTRDEQSSDADEPRRVMRSSSRRSVMISKVEQCESARTGLRAVQMKKRKGYSLAEAAQLEAALREHRDDPINVLVSQGR